MAFNIWRSGTLDDAPGGRRNLTQLVEFVRAEDPDVVFMVETYGSGDEIARGLNAGASGRRPYTGTRVTREPGQEPARDNLWLFSRLPVEEVYPPAGGGGLTSFNFGGARLGLPAGGHVHAFVTWLYHAPVGWDRADLAALESDLGYPRTHTEEEVVASDRERRAQMAVTLLDERLPAYVGDDSAPVILGGDFNTLSHLDWTARFAGAAGHGGLVLDWPVMRMFEEAGFTDAYRAAHPDAGRFPGRTWSPVNGFGYAPGRIDYVLARGDVDVLAAHTRTRRLDRHRGDPLDAAFPFYSDHGALVADLLVRGPGPGLAPGWERVLDEPDERSPGWADPVDRWRFSRRGGG